MENQNTNFNSNNGDNINQDAVSTSAAILRLNAAIETLSLNVNNLNTNLSNLSKNINLTGVATTKTTNEANIGLRNVATGTKKVNTQLVTFKKIFKSLGITFAITTLSNVIARAFKESSDYTETLNYFSVSLGNNAKAAKSTIDSWQQLLGIDPRGAMEYWGDFNLLLQGFGDGSKQWVDASYQMSQGLTQMVYDFSSIKNVDFATTYMKLNSAMAGQSRALSRWGIDVSIASLQEYALSKGIQKRVEVMTQAEKAQLRYALIMEKTSQQMMGVQNDLERTLTTPANALRIVKQQLQALYRAIGTLITPLISVMLPKLRDLLYAITAVVNQLAVSVMQLFGYTEEDYLSMFTKDLDDVSDSAEDASDAVNGLVSGIDKFNVINKGSTNANKTRSQFYGNLLDLSPYNFIKNYEELASTGTAKVAKDLKPLLDIIKSINDALTTLIEKLGGIGSVLSSLVITFAIYKTLNSLPMLLEKISLALFSLQMSAGAFKSVLMDKFLPLALIFATIIAIQKLIKSWDSLTAKQKLVRGSIVTLLGTFTAFYTFIKVGALVNVKALVSAFANLKAVLVSLVTPLKNALTALAKLSVGMTTLQLSMIGIAALATGITLFISKFEELSTWERWLIPLAAAITGVAIALAMLRIAQSGPAAAFTAGSIAAGVTLGVGAIIGAKTKFADGGYINPGATFIAGEKGPEWVGSQGSTSTIINDKQMSTIMEESVRKGVSDAMGNGGTSTIQIDFTGVGNGLARELAKPIADQFRKQNIKVRGI